MLRPHAWGYARVSHRSSKEAGLSIPSQHRIIADYYEKLRVTDEYLCFGETFVDEEVSAWSKHLRIRPAGRELVSTVKRGDHIIFTSMDRGFRNVKDFACQLQSWDNHGVHLHFADLDCDASSAAGRAIVQMAAVFAELESSLKSERNREAHAARMAGFGKQNKRSAKTTIYVGNNEQPLVIPDEQQPGRIWSYLRVSHLDSANRGLGVESQRTACQRWLKLNPHLTFAEELYDAAVSAYSVDLLDRPAGRKLRQLQRGDTILIAKMDRAFRNMRNFANTWELWKQQGVNVHIIDMNLDLSTPTGKLWSGMMCLFAEWESAVKSQRTRDGLAASAAMGHFAKPKLPCGTKWLRKAGRRILVPDWPARKIMRWIAYMRFIHSLSFQKIADRLEEILSKREGRRYVPEYGVRSRNKIQRKHWRGGVRKWSCTKVRKAIPLVRELWPEMYGDEPLSRTAAKAG